MFVHILRKKQQDQFFRDYGIGHGRNHFRIDVANDFARPIVAFGLRNPRRFFDPAVALVLIDRWRDANVVCRCFQAFNGV